ncbi:hypothetical protein [Brevundimonas goettingensis]|uniref:Anti-sigma factor n=1 Tax=Brevundimonas goettingensis TaxID=2774190 RepID=A0A975GVP4_9CAUL|nr:hypothetical protein [Brevundimonas goettingensis]QTC91676.1 hypothetical protein IFJ75_01695 [Brevundimonas goettingensis]
MTQFDDETLMRRADGELSPERAAEVDAAAAADPALAARLAAFRSDRTTAREAFPIAPDPRDADLMRMIGGGAKAKASSGWTERLKAAFAPQSAPIWGGLATACFVGGLALGWLGMRPTPEGFAVQPGGVIADAGLVRVLDQRLAADGADGQGRAIGLTFRDAEGRWCRTFQAGEAGVAGLACRRDGHWAVQALAPFEAGSTEVRTASSDTPAVVLAAVDATLAGETVAGEEEAKARAAGWK